RHRPVRWEPAHGPPARPAAPAGCARPRRARRRPRDARGRGERGSGDRDAPRRCGWVAPPLRTAAPATVWDDDVVVGTEARPRTLRVVSSAAGGTAPGPAYRDTTGRLHLESHQPRFGSYGETVRVHRKHPRAKGMIAYLGDWDTPHHGRSDYTWLATQPRDPVTVAWIGAHFLDNDTPDDDEANLRHGHDHIEVPDSTGALRARLEIQLNDP